MNLNIFQNRRTTVSSLLTGEDISFFHISQSVNYHVWRSHYWTLFWTTVITQMQDDSNLRWPPE